MTPKSFDIDTAKHIVGDSRMRVIEAKARADADAGKYDAPQHVEGAYWDRVRSDMEYVIYITTHQKRLERAARIQQRSQKEKT
ncbi:hypothetical protein UFOVP393_77 [uncultured Caudovirales phage]|uniref:Uncharacterized protein n=1 Tax=uncultured Caudovirales phage TaxID=2100421 RepID=A0A6J7X1M4_9CAUD|nr:hypothetical protein UFOVP393_77 [uncultured Caudovirales phage]